MNLTPQRGHLTGAKFGGDFLGSQGIPHADPTQNNDGFRGACPRDRDRRRGRLNVDFGPTRCLDNVWVCVLPLGLLGDTQIVDPKRSPGPWLRHVGAETKLAKINKYN